jgi:hypothetical protein
MKREKNPHSFTQTAPRPVPDHGRTDLAGRSKTRPCCVSRLRPAADLDDQQLPALGYAPRYVEEFTPRAQALDGHGWLI